MLRALFTFFFLRGFALKRTPSTGHTGGAGVLSQVERSAASGSACVFLLGRAGVVWQTRQRLVRVIRQFRSHFAPRPQNNTRECVCVCSDIRLRYLVQADKTLHFP